MDIFIEGLDVINLNGEAYRFILLIAKCVNQICLLIDALFNLFMSHLAVQINCCALVPAM